MPTTEDVPLISRKLPGAYGPLPFEYEDLTYTQGPPGRGRQALAILLFLASTAGLTALLWCFPLPAGLSLLAFITIALITDACRLLRFRRTAANGPHCQQGIFKQYRRRCITLIRLKDPAKRDKVLKQARDAALSMDGVLLAMAGRPACTWKRSPALSGDWGRGETTPWHLMLLTNHKGEGENYAAFCQASGLQDPSVVEHVFHTGFEVPTPLITILIPLVFDVVGVIVSTADYLLGRPPRSSFEYHPCIYEELQGLVAFSETCLKDRSSAAQPFMIMNLMKPAEDAADQKEDKGYMVKQLTMFATALNIRPFILQVGSTKKMGKAAEPHFDTIICVFHPNAVWLNRMLQSTLFNGGPQKKLGDMENMLIAPMDISKKKVD